MNCVARDLYCIEASRKLNRLKVWESTKNSNKQYDGSSILDYSNRRYDHSLKQTFSKFYFDQVNYIIINICNSV